MVFTWLILHIGQFHQVHGGLITYLLAYLVVTVHVNEVTLRRAQLVLQWVTVHEFESCSYRLGI